MTKLSLLVLCLPTQPSIDTAPKAPMRERTVGVFSVSVSGLEPEIESSAIDALANAVAGIEGFEAISRNDFNAMLSAEVVKDQLGCNDVSCLAEIGAAAGVSLIVSGSVSVVEGTLLVNLQLTNTEYASVENRTQISWSGDSARLGEVLAVAVEILLLKAAQRRPGKLRLGRIPDSAGILINGEARGASPSTIEDLPVGVHRLRVEAEGYIAQEQDFLICSGRVTQLEAYLEEEPLFYTKWWFWSGAGVLAIGGGATAAALLLREDAAKPRTGMEITTLDPVNN